MNGNTKIFGIINYAYFNRNSEGALRYWATREQRDAALKALRERAVGHGLSESASVAGIYEVSGHVRDLTESQREDLKLLGCAEVRG